MLQFNIYLGYYKIILCEHQIVLVLNSQNINIFIKTMFMKEHYVKKLGVL